jgi:hypothetical protein
MAGRLDEIRLTVEQPSLVARDVKYPRRNNHYRRVLVEPGWLKVVVNYRPIPPQGTWLGEVITAHPVDGPKRKEALLWP